MTTWEKMYGGFVRDPATGALVVSSTGQVASAVEISDGSSSNLLHVLADGSINVNSTPGVEGATAASGAALPALFKVIAGSDGTLTRPIKTDTSGVLQIDLAAPIPAGSATIGSVKVTDGTNTGAVKAASTAAVATDPAVVVAVSPNNSVAVTGTVTGNQGTAAAASGAWPAKVTDGTNVSAVKAASTAPVATDPALVVTLSPNGAAQPATATQPVSGTVTANQGTAAAVANAWPAKVSDGTNTAALLTAAPAGTEQGLAVRPITNDLTATGTIASAVSITLALPPGAASATLQIIPTGSNSSVLAFEASQDGGTTYHALNMFPIDQLGQSPQQGATNSAFIIRYWGAAVSGYTHVRCRCSTYVSPDSLAITWRASMSTSFASLVGPIAAQGLAAEGVSRAGAPLPVAGVDGGTLIRTHDLRLKSTQSTYALGVQNLRDSGRVGITVSGYQVAGTITTETAMSLVRQADGVAAGAATSFTVTSGKRLRLQQLMAQYKQNAAAVSTQKIALRYASTTPTNASPVIAYLDLESTSATTGTMVGPYFFDFPDGFEIPATFVYSIFNLASATTNLVTITLLGYEY